MKPSAAPERRWRQQAWLWYCWFVGILLIGVCTPGHASLTLEISEQPIRLLEPDESHLAVRLHGGSRRFPINQTLQMLEDTHGQWQVEDVASAPLSEQFQPLHRNIINFGFTQSTYWMRFDVAYPRTGSNRAQQQRWYLEVGRAQIREAELFVPQPDGSFTRIQADTRMPYEAREVRHPNSVFPFTVELGTQKTLYLRLRNDNALFFPVTVWTPLGFAEKVAVEEFIYGLFFGSLIIMTLYNLFIYFSIGDRSYLYYVLFLIGITLFEFIEMGHGITLFDNAHKNLTNELIPFTLWFTWLAVLAFCRSFLETAQHHGRIDFVLRVLMYMVLVNIGLSLFMSHYHTQMWLSWFSLFTMAGIVLLGYYSLRQGNQNAVYFTLGWAFTMSGGIVFTSVLLGWLPSTQLLLSSAPIGIMLGTILLSFALSDRIKRMQRDAMTANRRAMRHLERFRSVFNNAVEGLYRMSIDGRLVSANPALARMLGYGSVRELKQAGQAAVLRFYPQPAQQYAVIGREGRWLAEQPIVTALGEERWCEHSAQLIVDKRRVPSHIEGRVVDITERKKKERVEQESDAARREQEVAQASAVAKGEFLANMSHEIRTPLTAIIGYSESLQDAELNNEEQQQAISTVIRSSQHLLHLIDDMLDFTNIEAQRLQIHCEPMDMFELLREVETYFTLKAAQQGLYFRVQYHFPLPPTLTADATRLKQILLNLCSNAIKFTKQGGVVIDVSWRDDTRQVCFSVQDTGIGLTTEQRQRLFQVYTQAETSTSRQFGGTGLGLVISKQLAELMGGTITVRSEPGKGSHFDVTIGGEVAPRLLWVDDVPAPSRPLTEESNERLPVLSGTVLYADDDEPSRGLLQLMLKQSGVALSCVQNGLEAVDAVRAQVFDLVLLDIQMPVMDGLAAARLLREKGYQGPILAVTAHVMPQEVARYEAAGFTGWLAKPLDRRAFYQALRRYVGGQP